MAKSKSKGKKVLEEEEELQEEPGAEEVDVEDVEETEDTFDAEEPEAEDAEVADAEETEDTFDSDEPEAEYAEEDTEPPVEDEEEDENETPPPSGPPPAKISKLAIALIFLNWIAAPGFLYVAINDHVARTQYSYRTLLNHAQVWGLPLQSEDEFPSVSNHTRPVQRYTAEQLKSAFKARQKTSPFGSDNFQPVEEEVPVFLKPSDMTDEVLRDLFWDLSQPVKTLEDEIERLKEVLPREIKNSAKEVADHLAKMKEEDKRTFVLKNLAMPGDAAAVKKAEDDVAAADAKTLDALVKRAVVQRTLFPLVPDVRLVKKLDDQVNAATGAELDKLVEESVQRRLHYDILAPINVFRPADFGPEPAKQRKFRVERIAEFKPAGVEKNLQAGFEFKLTDLEKHLQARLDSAIADKYDENVHMGDVFKKAAHASYNKDDGLPTGSVVSEWRGSQGLSGNGTLAFEFYQGGKAFMLDADGHTTGTWKKDGTRVTLNFKSSKRTSTYTGTIEGTTMSGTSNAAGTEFNWTVRLARSYGAEILIERDSVEKRKFIAFLLFTISQVQKPIVGKKFLEKSLERAQVVSGLYEFTNASIQYVRTLQTLENRLAQAAFVDRQGWIVTINKGGKDEVTRTPGFIDDYGLEIDRLVKIVERIDTNEKRLADLTKQRAHFAMIYEQRAMQHKKALERLLDARTRTKSYDDDLREKQQQLHDALKELSDAGERNFELEAEIRRLTREYEDKERKLLQRGGKRP